MSTTLGDNIREARKRAGLTQEQAAGLIPVSSKTTVARWERGERTPAADVIPAIARALGTTPDKLLRGV